MLTVGTNGLVLLPQFRDLLQHCRHADPGFVLYKLQPARLAQLLSKAQFFTQQLDLFSQFLELKRRLHLLPPRRLRLESVQPIVA